MKKQCTKCEKQKPLSDFYKDKRATDGLYSSCKECGYKYYKIHKVRIIKRIGKHQKTFIGSLCHRFQNIKQRCNNPKNRDYKNYGGRGIKCLFKNTNEFVNYVLDELHIDPRGLFIDRINNDGHYEKDNIRFVTIAESNKNKKRKK